MKLKCIICALLAASAFLSTYSFGDDDHTEKSSSTRSVQDKKITNTTAKFAGRYFSYLKDDKAQAAEFKKRYESEKFEGKTLVESINGVKDFSQSAINARKEPSADAIELERPIAKAIADMLFVIDQKGYDEAGAELVKLVEGYRTQAGSDSQAEEFQKRLLVAMQNFDPKGDEKKEVKPKNEEMNAFAEAWKEERAKVEKDLKAQLKLRDDAIAGNESARRELFKGANALGKDLPVKLAHMAERSGVGEMKKWLKAVAPKGQMSLNNKDGEPVTMNLAGLNNEQLKKVFQDPKMLASSFVGTPHPENSGAKEWEWTKDGIGLKPGISPQLAGASQGQAARPASSSGAAKGNGDTVASSQRGAALFKTNCTSCHHNRVGPMSAEGARRVMTDMPKNEALAAALTTEDRQAIADYINSQLTAGQVAAR